MKRKSPIIKRPARRGAESITRGIREIEAMIQDGAKPEERFTVRTVRTVEPGVYDAGAVRQTRRRLNVSQSVFAQILGVSTILVQAWEQDRRPPNKMARRLLDEINRDLGRWRAMASPREVVATGR